MVSVNGATVRKGFRLPERTALINFSGTDYDGAEIRVLLSVTFAQFIELRKAAQGEDDGVTAQLFGAYALMDWNLEDADGKPIPADSDGILAIPLELTNLVIQHWVEEVVRVPSPLSKPSGDINTLVEASTAMETE